MLLLNIAAVIWLGLCYAASVKMPTELRFIALFSLTTPAAISTNFFFVGYWLLSRRKWRLLLSLMVLLLSFNMILAVFGLRFFSKNDWSKSPTGFKLMSWNTHAMGIYHVEKEKQIAADIVALINKEAPDILCLPEFAVNINPVKNKSLRKLINDNDYRVYKINTDHFLYNKIIIGTALLTKYPLKDYKVYDLGEEIFLSQFDLLLPGNKVIRVFVTHLHSFNLSDRDKDYFERLKQNSDNIKKSKSFLYRFDNAYIARAREANQIRSIMNQSPYPSIICGDFNDLPYSYTYTTIKGNLTDAFVKKGVGFGRTYNQLFPTLRIDYIFYDDTAFRLKAFKTIPTKLSDHNPVVSQLEWIP